MLPSPLQLLVIGLDSPLQDLSLAAPALGASGQVRLVDVLGVHKDQEGAIWSVEVPGLEAMPVLQASPACEPGCGALIALLGMAASAGGRMPQTAGSGLAPADILDIAARIPPGGDALLLLLEHSWLRALHSAVGASDGWLAGGFLDHESLRTLAAEDSA